MGRILPQIDHIIVVMLENRSLDNLCGWLYADAPPGHLIPQGSNPSFDGVNTGLWNPSNSSYFQGQPPEKVFVVKGASSATVPNPDPQETFDHITFQLYGPQGPGSDPDQLMQCYTPDPASNPGAVWSVSSRFPVGSDDRQAVPGDEADRQPLRHRHASGRGGASPPRRWHRNQFRRDPRPSSHSSPAA